MRAFAALISAALLCACASAGPAFAPSPPRSAWIVAADGRPAGQAVFTEAPAGVLIRLEFSPHGLPPGWHGVHLHQSSDCSDFAAGFQASGAHLGHGEDVQHGLLNPAGPELGDMPNVFAPQAGRFGAEFYLPGLTLSPTPAKGRATLLDANGTALIIHAGPDDQLSQPIGGAGARIACAAITLTP